MNSPLETLFAETLDAFFEGRTAIPYEREYRFAAPRKWRFDFAFPAHRVACEINGGIYNKGRHIQPKGYMDDCEKLREAAKLGWRVLTFPGPTLEENPAECIQDLAIALGIASLN